jgi:hypothetical protein
MIKVARLALLMAGLISVAPAAVSAQGRMDGADGVGEYGVAVPGEEVFHLDLGPGLRQTVLVAAPPQPRGAIVMMPGGSGEVGIRRDGDLRHDDNFVVRTRSAWVARGYAVVIPDAVDSENLRGLRSSPGYAALVETLIGFAHSKAPGPVFLLGTSQGSIAAMNGASHARPGSLAGVVLTESVSRLGGSHETVFDADPQDVRVPALVMANRDDACDVAPPQDAPRIGKSMSRSPSVEVQYVAGGIYRSKKACGSLTPHGYYGIENDVVARIAQWMAQVN